MTAEALPRPRPRPDGTPTARERLERLLDEGSFIEFYLFRPQGGSARTDGVVTGAGTVYGRSVFVYTQDFGVLGDSFSAAHAAKIHKVMDLALAAGAPLIALSDSGAARISAAVTALTGYDGIFRHRVRASGAIPQISISCGPPADAVVIRHLLELLPASRHNFGLAQPASTAVNLEPPSRSSRNLEVNQGLQATTTI